MTNNEKLKAILAERQISASRCAEIISNLTQCPYSERTVRSWIDDPNKPSARSCPDNIFELLEKHFEKTQMLLPSTFMTSDNTTLTIKDLNWVLKNAAVIGPNTLDKFKKRANHPLMKEESAYDDVPIKVQAAFAMEPYFPRKLFDRAFSWLFGKETILQIDAESFRYHEQLKNKNKCYSLSENWSQLPFTQDEYCHIYGQFSQLFDEPHDGYLSACENGLRRHCQLMPEIYFNNKNKGFISFGACTEIADYVFDEDIRKFNELNDTPLRKENIRELINAIKFPVSFKNLSMEKRNSLFSMFSVEQFGLTAVRNIYRKAIPNHIFNELLKKDLIDSETARMNKDVLMDTRLPLELATEIAFSSPETYASVYFGREDVNAELRNKFILTLTQLAETAIGRSVFDVVRGIGGLILTGLPTLPEIELIVAHYDDMAHRYSSGHADAPDAELIRQYHDDIDHNLFVWSQKTGIELPPALQDKLTESGFKTAIQTQLYHDVSSLVDAIKAYYGVNDSDRPVKPILNLFPTVVLSNKHWTHDHLLDLVHASRQEGNPFVSQEDLDTFRQEIFRKLFSESFYPSLSRGDLTGRYGRAENLLAHLLNSDADMLSDFDINLIVHSGINLDYADHEVNLAASLVNHPELNERIIAERLRLRVEQLSDVPALAPASQRRAL